MGTQASEISQYLKQSQTINDHIWNIVQLWGIFSRQTIGLEWVKATDNLTLELFLLHSSSDTLQKKLPKLIQHLRKVQYWLDQAKRRKLIEEAVYAWFYDQLQKLAKELMAAQKN